MTGNPMQSLLRRQMGVDAFALDGDDTLLWETWQDRPRAPDAARKDAGAKPPTPAVRARR